MLIRAYIVASLELGAETDVHQIHCNQAKFKHLGLEMYPDDRGIGS